MRCSKTYFGRLSDPTCPGCKEKWTALEGTLWNAPERDSACAHARTLPRDSYSRWDVSRAATAPVEATILTERPRQEGATRRKPQAPTLRKAAPAAAAAGASGKRAADDDDDDDDDDGAAGPSQARGSQADAAGPSRRSSRTTTPRRSMAEPAPDADMDYDE